MQDSAIAYVESQKKVVQMPYPSEGTACVFPIWKPLKTQTEAVYSSMNATFQLQMLSTISLIPHNSDPDFDILIIELNNTFFSS